MDFYPAAFPNFPIDAINDVSCLCKFVSMTNENLLIAEFLFHHSPYHGAPKDIFINLTSLKSYEEIDYAQP